MIEMFKKASVVYVALALLALFSVPYQSVNAAALTSVKDVQTSLTASGASDHTISFVTPTGVANGETIVITMAAGFSLTGLIEDDIDISGSTFGELTTEPTSCTTAEALFTFSGQAMTFDLCSGNGASFAASETVTIEIGTNATASGTGANQIDNPTAADDINNSIGGTQTDSGDWAVSIISDDVVVVTATVDETIAFTINDNAVGFGNLSSTVGRWANGAGTGVNASATTPTEAHQMTIATNGTGGWAITYSGATLTNGGNTITEIAAAIDEDSDGTIGSEEFGLAVSTDGDSTVDAGYLRDSVSDWDYDSSGTTQIISEAVPTTVETLSVSYLANITGATEAGSYTTSITYIATGTF